MHLAHKHRHPEHWNPHNRLWVSHGIEIDWMNPITRGLVCAAPFTDPGNSVIHNLVPGYSDGIIESNAINPTWQPTSQGVGFRVDQNSGQARNYGIDFGANPVTGTTPRTAFILSYKRGTTANNYIVALGPAVSATGEDWRFRYDEGNGSVLRVEITGSAYVSSLTPPVGQVNAMACVYGGGTIGDHTLWLNGVKEQATGTAILNTGGDLHFLAADPWGFTATRSTGSTDIFLHYLLFSRALTDREILSLTNDPWQIYRPRHTRVWVPAAGLRISPTGIASAEAFGAHQVDTGPVNISPGGISSAEAFGSATLQAVVTIYPSGIASTEAFGGAQVVVGPVTITPSGISSAEAFGTADLTGVLTISPSGIASLEGFGSALLTLGPVELLPAGIGSAEAFGVATLDDGSVVKARWFIRQKGEIIGTLSVIDTNLRTRH